MKCGYNEMGMGSYDGEGIFTTLNLVDFTFWSDMLLSLEVLLFLSELLAEAASSSSLVFGFARLVTRRGLA